MRTILILILLLFCMFGIGLYCESQQKPDALGSHFDYSVICENGIKYKVLSNRRGVIMLLNSDGTPVKCNKDQY